MAPLVVHAGTVGRAQVQALLHLQALAMLTAFGEGRALHHGLQPAELGEQFLARRLDAGTHVVAVDLDAERPLHFRIERVAPEQRDQVGVLGLEGARERGEPGLGALDVVLEAAEGELERADLSILGGDDAAVFDARDRGVDEPAGSRQKQCQGDRLATPSEGHYPHAPARAQQQLAIGEQHPGHATHIAAQPVREFPHGNEQGDADNHRSPQAVFPQISMRPVDSPGCVVGVSPLSPAVRRQASRGSRRKHRDGNNGCPCWQGN